VEEQKEVGEMVGFKEEFLKIFSNLKVEYFLIPLMAFITPIKALIIIVGLAIMTDLFFGIWKSIKLKKRLTSNGFGRTIVKMFIYQLVLIGGFVIDKYILNELILIFLQVELLTTKLLAIYLVFSEATSINENLYEITKIDFFDRFMKFIKQAFKFKNTLKELGE
jgi:hypothetical protein